MLCATILALNQWSSQAEIPFCQLRKEFTRPHWLEFANKGNRWMWNSWLCINLYLMIQVIDWAKPQSYDLVQEKYYCSTSKNINTYKNIYNINKYYRSHLTMETDCTNFHSAHSIHLPVQFWWMKAISFLFLFWWWMFSGILLLPPHPCPLQRGTRMCSLLIFPSTSHISL